MQRCACNCVCVHLCGLTNTIMPVATFNSSKYWPGPLYQDKGKQFYRTLGNGEVVKGTRRAALKLSAKSHRSLIGLLLKGTKMNMVGDGRHLGGHLVVGTDGNVVWMQREVQYGIFASVEQVCSLLLDWSMTHWHHGMVLLSTTVA